MKKIHYFSTLLIAMGAYVLTACSVNDNPSQPSSDTEAPVIKILEPSTEGVFSTTDGSITISGTASDNVQVKSVKYTSSAGLSGIADGLENWKISNLELADGDNIVKVTAYDTSDNQNTAEITITKNQNVVFLGAPYVSNDVFYTNEAIQTWITTSIASNDNIISSSVRLIEVDENNQEIAEICSLYDDGDLQLHGDEIKGDNVYSTLYTFNFPSEATRKYRVAVKTNDGNETTEALSSTFTITVVDKQKAEMQVQALVETQEDVEQKISALVDEGLSTAEIESEIKQWLTTMPAVESVSSDNGCITINHKSGLESYILLNASNETKGGDNNLQVSNRRSKALIPLAKQTRGTLAGITTMQYAKHAITRSINAESNIIQNKNVLIWAPFADQMAPMADDLLPIFNASSASLNTTYLSNESCTAASLKDLTKYGIIVFDTHGYNADWLLTREKISQIATLVGEDLYNLFSSSFKIVTMNDGNTYYAITAKYIKNHIKGSFANSVIFNGSCESMKTDNLANTFINKGAKTYLGFSKNVLISECRNKAVEFFTALAGTDLNTTGEAFIEDLTLNDGCAYLMAGSTNMHFTIGLINGDFEYGNLNGWNVNGDGRVITQLGSLKPSQPYYMGIVSTGLGYTENYGSIYQTFTVTNETTLSLKWNFISEEFLEYVGSIYQDFLKVSIADGNTTETIFYMSIDDFASKYNLEYVSPDVVFDQGDAYMTGWQVSTFDISKYQGKSITLFIETGDIGDSIFDSATLLDEIQAF